VIHETVDVQPSSGKGERPVVSDHRNRLVLNKSDVRARITVRKQSAEAASGAPSKKVHDRSKWERRYAANARIADTVVVLRRFSIDEMPQFINVLRQDMSVVGPRPPLRREVEAYDDDVRRRLLVKPGITGLWQVSGRSELSWDNAVRLDLSYVDNWSMVIDIVIIAKTVRAVTQRKGAY
jgi:lipopolysaccharide/colanic/teichoic acid biosynthesis glycosyltransferase